MFIHKIHMFIDLFTCIYLYVRNCQKLTKYVYLKITAKHMLYIGTNKHMKPIHHTITNRCICV